ncbi:hypothetical protein L6164_001444 [Bauhinia variegata]|uniref:Uncharacterized protein n=1 Tax=Bauhinia variegata TaxID=167791 RepID=A0ACB9QGF6_BAUVA|nr:hypothetical protein L6164_001444 [Bauhinia variegata]
MLGKREREEEGVEEMDNSEWRTAGDSMRSSTSKRMTVPTSVAASSVDEDLIPPHPSYVRRQTGSYADSFAKHAQRFKNDMDKVHKWKAALKQASNLSGLDSAIIRPETKLIRKIVKDISRKLRRNSSYDLEGLAMGHEIVCHPNVHKSGIGRRLRKHEDIYNALKKRKITEEIYGISLDMSQIKEIILRANAFKKMDSLKILKFYSHFDGSRLRLPNGLRNLPEELISFQWDGYPHRCVPLNSCAENIVELIMTDSHVKRLWNGNQHLPNLKTIILQRSKHLIGIPDLSMAPNIRHLDVSWCPSLAQVYSSGFLPDLQNLYLIDCDAMKTVNIGGNKIERRSWRLLADYEFFILCFPCTLHKVHMKIFKSDNSNTYTFRFNSVSAQLGRILESESSDYQSLGLALVHLNLKSALPNLELLCLSDNPPSIGSLSEHLYFNFCYSCGIKGICMLCTSPGRTRQQKFSVPPKGTGNKEVLGSSWDWEDLIGINDSIMDQNIYICNCRLSKIPSNNIHWPCLTQVSLHRNESNGILNFLASVCDEVSRSDLLLLYDCTRRQFTEEFTFSLDSENPQKISDIHFNLGDKQNLHHRLAIYFSGEEWSEKKTIYSGGDNYCQKPKREVKRPYWTRNFV